MEPVLSEAEDWIYVGEGGHHALFAFHGKTRQFDGLLLSLSKADLARSEWMQSEPLPSSSDDNPASISYLNDTGSDDSTSFVREVISGCLSLQYIDIPRMVLVDWCLLSRLRRRALDQDVIPPRRRHAWTTTRPEKTSLPIARGVLVPNYRRWNLPHTNIAQPDHTDHDCMSIEIKPKAGYTAFSPLVDPQRRVKFWKTRFQLLQGLHSRGLVQKAWTNPRKEDSHKTSHYNPLDLFSNDTDRIHKAVEALVDCPQNNLRVWCRDAFVVGVQSSGSEVTPNWNVLADFFNVEANQARSVLVKAISSILQQEALLEEIHNLQLLDILDADGAILVYERLVELLGGAHDNAQALLDVYQPKSTQDDKSPAIHSLLRHSPLQPPQNVSRINQYCVLADYFRQKLVSISAETCEAPFLDQARSDALVLLNSFDEIDCRFLLQNWLLSLVMCDVSLFVRCRPAVDNNASTATNVSSVSISTSHILQYDLKVVDCDRKPANKLQGRLDKEVMFNHVLLNS
jgi:hypothetical protein